MPGHRWTSLPSPIGPLLAVADGAALTCLWFGPSAARPQVPALQERFVPAPEAEGPLGAAGEQLAEYFRGERTAFDLPLDPRGTEFERRVWSRLLDIPYGACVTYGDVARDVGEPGGAQAVGRAVGANPLGILVPCHRVVGADGTMTGFAGGLDRKAYLLDLEGYVTGATLLPPHYAAGPDDPVGPGTPSA